jgi:hypothetical protein
MKQTQRVDICGAALQAIWAKGYTELLDLMEKDVKTGNASAHIDCYGYGDDLDEVPSLTLISARPVPTSANQ